MLTVDEIRSVPLFAGLAATELRGGADPLCLTPYV
jgi:hypothetical protein